MRKKTIGQEHTILKCGTIIMVIYAVFIDKIKNTKMYQTLMCPKDTILINTEHDISPDDCATIIQTAIKDKLNSEKTSLIDTILHFLKIR